MLADRYDQRIVMVVILIGVAASCGLLSISTANGVSLLVALVFGGAISSVHSLCLCADIRPSGAIIRSRGVRTFADGLFNWRDHRPAADFFANVNPWACVLHYIRVRVRITFAIFVLFRIRSASLLPTSEEEQYVSLPDSSPAVMALDLRTEPDPQHRTGHLGNRRTTLTNDAQEREL